MFWENCRLQQCGLFDVGSWYEDLLKWHLMLTKCWFNCMFTVAIRRKCMYYVLQLSLACATCWCLALVFTLTLSDVWVNFVKPFKSLYVPLNKVHTYTCGLCSHLYSHKMRPGNVWNELGCLIGDKTSNCDFLTAISFYRLATDYKNKFKLINIDNNELTNICDTLP